MFFFNFSRAFYISSESKSNCNLPTFPSVTLDSTLLDIERFLLIGFIIDMFLFSMFCLVSVVSEKSRIVNTRS